MRFYPRSVQIPCNVASTPYIDGHVLKLIIIFSLMKHFLVFCLSRFFTVSLKTIFETLRTSHRSLFYLALLYLLCRCHLLLKNIKFFCVLASLALTRQPLPLLSYPLPSQLLCIPIFNNIIWCKMGDSSAKNFSPRKTFWKFLYSPADSRRYYYEQFKIFSLISLSDDNS